ncbi:hypothetical protein BDV93DRAFT_54587 [Ceratobasidium sp. AG-I]|nr:hypothetical protein BDV93DRAFT_54587 [Ceratobasidium sp. AG-I]
MGEIPHSTYEDEARFVAVINSMIDAGELQAFPSWSTAIKDTKAQNARRKKGAKEAKEAEQSARELGVWDEFYGSGKAGKRRGKGKGQAQSASNNEPEDDHSALKALIQSKAKKMDGFLDSLAEKYASTSKPGPKKGAAGRGRKRAAPVEDLDDQHDSEPSAKRRAKPKADAEEEVVSNPGKPRRGRSTKGTTKR